MNYVSDIVERHAIGISQELAVLGQIFISAPTSVELIGNETLLMLLGSLVKESDAVDALMELAERERERRKL